MYKEFELHQLVNPSFKINQETDLCHICMDLLVLPIQCSVCKSRFCKYCADKWNQGSHRCPNKCSEKWQYKPIPSLKLKLRCPFKCETLILPDEFQIHLRGCVKSPEIYKNEFYEQEMKLQYKCKNNHHLAYISDTKDIPLNNGCTICHDKSLPARNICNECKITGKGAYTYCCVCRFPKGLAKTCCPVNHTMFDVKPSSACSGALCELCSKPVLENGPACVQDHDCRLTMCMKCFLHLEAGNGIPDHSSSHSLNVDPPLPTLGSRQSSQVSNTSSSQSQDNQFDKEFRFSLGVH